MKKRGTIKSTLGILMLGLVFTACESNSPVSLEESLRDTPNVQLKEGATDVSIKVNKDNVRSYFKIELDNLLPESNMRDGQYNAWCVLYDTPINSNGGEYNGVKLHTADQDAALQKVGYIVNNKVRFMRDLDADWKDIQVAIWSVLDFPRFNYTSDLSKMPPEFRNNGVPTFNTENVDQILADITAAGDGHVEEGCAIYLVETDPGQQNVIIEECETITARMEDIPEGHNFIFDGHEWFSYVEYPTTNNDENTRDEVCDAGFDTYYMYSNKTYQGVFCFVNDDDGNYRYRIILTEEWAAFETQVEIVLNPNDFPQPVPWAFGQYTNKSNFDPTSDTGIQNATGPNVAPGTTVYVSAHAVTFEKP
ncbi:MAG: hypothetical protein ACNA8K_00060 [Cyclonatronaceae bacterium]